MITDAVVTPATTSAESQRRSYARIHASARARAGMTAPTAWAASRASASSAPAVRVPPQPASRHQARDRAARTPGARRRASWRAGAATGTTAGPRSALRGTSRAPRHSAIARACGVRERVDAGRLFHADLRKLLDRHQRVRHFAIPVQRGRLVLRHGLIEPRLRRLVVPLVPSRVVERLKQAGADGPDDRVARQQLPEVAAQAAERAGQ